MTNRWAEIFGADWPYIRTLGAAIKDPEEKKAFWDGVREAKEKDPKWSIYDCFPISESATKRAMRECVNHIRSLKKLPVVNDAKESVTAEMPKLPGDIPE
jgi:hypothetical protein